MCDPPSFPSSTPGCPCRKAQRSAGVRPCGSGADPDGYRLRAAGLCHPLDKVLPPPPPLPLLSWGLPSGFVLGRGESDWGHLGPSRWGADWKWAVPLPLSLFPVRRACCPPQRPSRGRWSWSGARRTRSTCGGWSGTCRGRCRSPRPTWWCTTRARTCWTVTDSGAWPSARRWDPSGAAQQGPSGPHGQCQPP